MENSQLEPQKGYWFAQYRRSPRKFKFSQPVATKYEKKFSPTKWRGGGGGAYTMENNDTKTDYQEVVRVGDQKWEMVEITIRIIFFCLRFIFTIFIYTGNFQVPPEKYHLHSKCQFPPKIPIWPLLCVFVCKIHSFTCQRWQFQAFYGSTNKKFMLCLADFGH